MGTLSARDSAIQSVFAVVISTQPGNPRARTRHLCRRRPHNPIRRGTRGPPRDEVGSIHLAVEEVAGVGDDADIELDRAPDSLCKGI